MTVTTIHHKKEGGKHSALDHSLLSLDHRFNHQMVSLSNFTFN